MNAEQIKQFIATFKAPKTLVEAVQVFADPDTAHNFMTSLRWPNGVCCARCGSIRVRYIQTRRVWECREDHDSKRFSVKTGTIMEESPLSLSKWLAAFWLEANSKNSISSWELHRALGITQKSAWFMLHRIRLALKDGSFDKFGGGGGIVEADETFIGGKSRNIHKADRARKITGTGGAGKTAVMGLLERHSEKGKSKVKAKVLKTTRKHEVQGHINDHVESGTFVFTDSLKSYTGLPADFAHEFVNHAETYVRGAVHTNGLENFWSLFKRCIKGTHVSIEPYHLAAYVDSEAFRFNNRDTNDGGRLLRALAGMEGKRLTYKALTGRDEQADSSQLV